MSTEKIWVLYHADCMDGYAAAWAAWKKFGDQATYKAVRHYQPIPQFDEGATLYILDFCYPVDVLLLAAKKAKSIVVLDHHISAEQSFLAYDGALPASLTLNFIQHQSGCMIAWDYFHDTATPPLLLKHIEDHDLWRHELKETEAICKALYLRLPLRFEYFEALKLSTLQKEGRILLKQHQLIVRRLVNAKHSFELLGAKGLAVNASGMFSSDVGHALAKQSGTFGMTYFYHGKKQQFECGLRSIGDFDVSKLAMNFGGGGHKNASGFSLSKAKFLALFS